MRLVVVNIKVEMALVVKNYEYKEELKNQSSPEYKEIEKNFTAEVCFGTLIRLSLKELPFPLFWQFLSFF